ncbi:MAG: immunity 49 family protein [Myxococcales bacterium]|nr:immunity 49 family protein [Myxococcales bacterium]
MTKALKRHAISNEFQVEVLDHFRNNATRNARGRAATQARKDSRRPGDLAVLQRTRANTMLLIDDINSFWEFLNASVDYAVAGFRLWYAPGEVDVELCGQTLHLPGAMPGLGATPRDWWHAVACAKILRRAEAVQSLLAYDHAKFQRIPGQRDGYQLSLAAALRDFWLDSPDFDAHATRTEELGGAGTATISGPRLAKLDVSKLEVLRAIRAADATAFNQAALDALKAFKAFWGTGKRKSDPDSYHDWLGTALAIDGESRGLTYEVESDYTPRWLIDGPPAGLLDHFKTLYEVTGES